MEAITSSSNTVTTIKKLAKSIVKLMMPHMEDLVDEDTSTLLESFIEGYNVQIDPQLALRILQDTAVEMISVADYVLKEIDTFGPA